MFAHSTMTNERLSSLALLHIHHDIPVNIENIIDEFDRQNPRRLQLSQYRIIINDVRVAYKIESHAFRARVTGSGCGRKIFGALRAPIILFAPPFFRILPTRLNSIMVLAYLEECVSLKAFLR